MAISPRTACCWLLSIFLAVTSAAHAQSLLPDVAPPFKASGTDVQKPVLKVGSFVKDDKAFDWPVFTAGNKAVSVRGHVGRYLTDRDQRFSLLVDGRVIMNIQFWGSASGPTGSGYPFKGIADGPAKLLIDKQAQTITYRKPYLLPDGKKAVYTQTLKQGDESKLIMSWDMGITQEQLKDYGRTITLAPWLIFSKHYRDQPITVNGKAITFESADQLTKEQRLVTQGNDLKLTYAPNDPLQQFTVTTSEYLSFNMRESNLKPGSDRYEMIIRTNNRQPRAQDSLVIDLGMTAKSDKQAQSPIASTDFWGNDRLYFQKPITRNIMPNPSFEQGLRYWKWWWGGARYVPTDVQAYNVSNDGYLGKQCLLIKPAPSRQAMMSFSIPVKKNQTYTISCYAKSDTAGQHFGFGAFSPLRGSEYSWQNGFKTKFQTSTEWKRYSFVYNSDHLAINLLLTGTSGNLWIDGIQIEEGDQLTDFTCPDVEGWLLTSDPDNAFEVGQHLDARLAMSGKPGMTGQVKLALENVFKEVLFTDDLSFTLDTKGQTVLPLNLKQEQIGQGVFVLKATYTTSSQQTYTDFYRLDVMTSLKNQRPSKNLYGSLTHAFRNTRTHDTLARYQRWGFGSTSYSSHYQIEHDLLQQYGIDNLLAIASDVVQGEQRELLRSIKKSMSEPPADLAKRVEQAAYDAAKLRPWVKNWALCTEVEGAPILKQKRFKEFSELIQIPSYHGFKRANPDITVYPDGGTSGYSMTRGFHEMEAYLKQSRGKVKWDAIAVHPYWNLDGSAGTNDWDAETQRLKQQMLRNGYDENTPIDFTECFNILPTDIPEWGADGWGDSYLSGIPTYNWGWREYMHATWVCRMFVMSLKHWPQLRSTNIWMARPYLDFYLSPWAMCKIPNTLGHLLPKPKFIADIRPMGGIRGYAFENEQGQPVIAIWCAIDRVEDGLDHGPQIHVDFHGMSPQFMDMMGNSRKAPMEDDKAVLQLSPAPIFIIGQKGQTQQLVNAMNQADVIGGSNTLNVAVVPELDGHVKLELKNQTNRQLTGKVQLSDQLIPYTVPAKQNQRYQINVPAADSFGKMFTWSDQIHVKQDAGPAFNVPWNMGYFYIPRTDSPLPADPASPLWDKIPAIAMDNVFVQKLNKNESPFKHGYKGDLDVTYQLAWDKDHLYLRIHAVDDVVHLTEASRWNPNQLYMHDGCVELYFDTTANGRTNQTKGFDLDDYRYDFYAGNVKATDGPGTVVRFYEPNMQYAGGLDMPTKEEASRGVTCQYQRTTDGYSYVMIFPARYLEPLRFEKGYKAGFGIYIHDIDDDRPWPRKGATLATEKAMHCDRRPHLWPVMVFGE
ncbi:MAG: carbohydrate binding domain-containing protein [Phycisphaeraceae bacterium JB051]